MKVSIITFHAADNCGSHLQAYALQQVLKSELNIDSEIIDYSNQNQRELYSLYLPFKSLKYCIINLYRSVFFFLIRRYKKSFQDFSRTYLTLTEQHYSLKEELKSLDGKFDIYITGSDQVWNTKAYDYDDSYFLDFVTCGKKIAYAPSLGATNIVESKESRRKISDFLSTFTAVSVRERNGKEVLKSVCSMDIPILLDPTLLLNREDWHSLIGERIIKKKYIFYYAFSYRKEANSIVKEISKRYGLPVYIVDAYAWALRRNFLEGFHLSPQFGPKAFLNLIYYSELVLTTSFHGTALSVALGKKFWYLETSMHNKNDDRAESLLNQLGIKDRIRDASYLLNNDCFADVKCQDEKMFQTCKNKSLEFLKKYVQ